MYRDIEEKLAARKQVKYADKFICGLPVGLKLPNGIIIGASAWSSYIPAYFPILRQLYFSRAQNWYSMYLRELYQTLEKRTPTKWPFWRQEHEPTLTRARKVRYMQSISSSPTSHFGAYFEKVVRHADVVHGVLHDITAPLIVCLSYSECWCRASTKKNRYQSTLQGKCMSW